MICVSFIGSQSKILDIATQPHPQAMLPMLHCHIKMIPDTMLKIKRTLFFCKICAGHWWFEYARVYVCNCAHWGERIYQMLSICEQKWFMLGKASTGKKRFLLGIARMRGGGLPMPDFFGPFSRSAFLVNKKSLFLQKCQCIELLTVF